MLIRQTKPSGSVRAFPVAISHVLVPVETQPPGDEPKDESHQVYMVLELEVMGQVHCNERVRGHVGLWLLSSKMDVVVVGGSQKGG